MKIITPLQMKNLSLYFIVLFSLSLKAQNLNYQWAAGMGGTGYDQGNSIAVDASGNVYTTGNFWGTVDFDPGAGISILTSNGNEGSFVQKLDASGNFLWAKAFAGSFGVRGNSIVLDASGNVYTTGYFVGTVDFDPGAGTSMLISNGSSDIFVQKLDAAGNFLWAKGFGGTSFDRGNSIAVDASGNVYATGYFIGTVDFDPGTGTSMLTSNGSLDIFVQKLDSSGNFAWAKAFGGTSGDRGISIANDAFGNVYTTGSFYGTADFDPGAGTSMLTSAGGTDSFVQKLDSLGNFGWAKAFGGTSDDGVNSIAVDASGNVYTTGRFARTVDFDPGAGTSMLTANANDDVFVQKLDALGNFVWAKAFGGIGNDAGLSIAVDASENVYTTGYFDLTSGGRDIFIQKLNASGNFAWAHGNFFWAKTFGGPSEDRGISIAVDASENVYTTGVFANTADFDPGAGTSMLTSNRYTDIFVAKYSQLPVSTAEYFTASPQTLAYPNPSAAFFTVKLPTAAEQIQILSTTGQLISRHEVKGISEIQLGAKLKKGVYLMRIGYADGSSEVKRLVKTD